MSNVTPFVAAFSAASSRPANRTFPNRSLADRANAHSRLSSELRAGLDQLEKELQAFRENEDRQ